MGQYHIITNIDKEESINPRTFGDGLKLLEISNSYYSTLSSLAFMLAGEWKNDIVFSVGDYLDDEDISDKLLDNLKNKGMSTDLYRSAEDNSKKHNGFGIKNADDINKKLSDCFDVSIQKSNWDKNYNEIIFNDEKTFEELSKVPFSEHDWLDDYENCIMYNSDKNESLIFDQDSLHCIAGTGNPMMPTFLYLTSLTNGKGGGDFEDLKDFDAGRWAGDKVGIVSKKLEPDLYQDILICAYAIDKDNANFNKSSFNEYFEEMINSHYLDRSDCQLKKNNNQQNANKFKI